MSKIRNIHRQVKKSKIFTGKVKKKLFAYFTIDQETFYGFQKSAVSLISKSDDFITNELRIVCFNSAFCRLRWNSKK